MIRMRKPVVDDRNILRIIREQLIPLNPPHLRPQWSANKMRERLSRGTTYVWLPNEAAKSGARGFITLIVEHGELFVDMLAVDDGMQGRGAGTELLKKAEKFGVSEGCRRMRLFVNDDNERGIRFYQKHGMAAVWHDPGIRSYVMEKRIG